VQAVADAREETRRAEAAAMTQRRLAATGELAAGIAHEINNPLGGLLNAIEALESGALPEAKRARYFQLVRSGLERIQQTVGKVLRLTPRSGGRAPWNAATPLSDALALVAHRAARQGVELVCAHPGGSTTDRDAAAQAWAALPTMHGEPHEIAQAILNLLVNALDALEGRPRGRIEVGARVEGADLVLEVADDGPGVEESELARVADLFYTTKDPGRGTGLGLAIVHGVAKEHGGVVELWSRPGLGFRAVLRLPIAAGGAA
jgi:signal transduction histidine kinase